jgi:GNAT superfamily N-acetyltransferase
LVITPDDARGQGLGTDLMAQAEAEAVRQGCRDIWLDTFAFQARSFYERLGFEVFGQIDGPPPAFPRVFMKKQLPRSSS